MTPVVRRRILVVGIGLTLLMVLLDLGGSVVPMRLRAAGAVAAGPAQRVLAGGDPTGTTRLEKDNVLLHTELAHDRASLAEAARLGLLLSSPAGHQPGALAARVIASTTMASGARAVTLDVGSRDGVEPGLAVVAADGLVGRVVSVGPWSSDVRVLGGADLTVGVRVGGARSMGAGSMGAVSATTPPDAPPRPRGMLSLILVDQGHIAVGDLVTTLGSVGERPYAAGLVVGRVASVDPQRGQLTATAVIRPAVDPGRLDVVAVLLGGPRDSPRSPAAAKAVP
ncbi:rod shape-determining protein MreC [Lapillicoccus sp.]|uniref:rod shape-determining protein MreC n=1 Tax=Lapillicoccus sp. TaxID=1909287 RepID=UPI0025E6534B|nr:rod shape-determining protein MreC [Lapillicoccus sp.]